MRSTGVFDRVFRTVAQRRLDARFTCRAARAGAAVDRGIDMATKKRDFATLPAGTRVTWHYRSAIGHGTVVGVHKMGTNADNTMYDVRQHDHHPGEPEIVHHTGKALSRA
jgi:hypothetical protein